MELNKTDLSFLNSCGPACRNDDILVEDYAINQFRVFDCSADFLHDTDISQIHVR